MTTFESMSKLAIEHKLTPVPEGFRIRETEEYIVEVWAMLFNWRLIVMLPNQTSTVEHGYCYFGRDLTALARAVSAGIEWENPLDTKPEGYDKQAF